MVSPPTTFALTVDSILHGFVTVSELRNRIQEQDDYQNRGVAVHRMLPFGHYNLLPLRIQRHPVSSPRVVWILAYHRFLKAVHDQPAAAYYSDGIFQGIAVGLFVFGQIFVLSSMYALGVTGRHNSLRLTL